MGEKNKSKSAIEYFHLGTSVEQSINNSIKSEILEETGNIDQKITQCKAGNNQDDWNFAL